MGRLSRNASLIRTLAWVAYALLVVLTAVLRSAIPSASLRAQVSDGLLYLLPIALTLLGALTLSIRAGRVERRLWRLVAAVSVLILCAETYYTWYVTTIDVHGPRFPASYQLMQLVAVFLGACVVVSLTDFGAATARSIVRFGLDVLGVMILFASGLYWFVLLPMFKGVPGEVWWGAAVAAIYPVVGLCIITFMSVPAAGGRTLRWRSWERLIATSFLLYGVGLVLSPIAYLQMRGSTDAQGSFWASVVLGFGYYVLFMATVYRFTASSRAIDVEPWFFPRLGPKWFSTAYPIMLAATLPLLGVGALEIGRNPEGVPIAAAAVALSVILVARSWLRSSEAMSHWFSANTDSETGIFNYRYLRKRLEDDLAYAKAAEASLSVITVGVEGLRTIANVGGSAEHTNALARIASALTATAGEDSSVCRTGTDVFVAIVRGADAETARELAVRLLTAAARAVEPLGVHVGLYAGVAVYPDHGDEPDQLLARSGAAQEVSALAEDTRVVVYDPSLEEEAGADSRPMFARTRSRRATARVLAAAVDARDPQTRRHSENVADLVSALALMLDLPADRGQVLDLAAQMHDVGKIGIADSALRARGEITDEQREQIEQHPVLGERILAAARLDEILPAVRHHHERWDGAGYPDGLRGTEIPLEARILAVCDAYESMTSPRSYGEDLAAEQAVVEIEQCSGTQFDPDIAGPFCRMISQIHGSSARDRAGRSGGEPPATSRLEGAS